MKTLGRTIPVFLVIILFFSCKKYENGPLISLRGKTSRLTGTWALDQYLRNGNDETNLVLISNYTETYTEDGKLSRAYTEEDGDPFSETGAWEWDADKAQIKISDVRSVEWSDANSTLSTSAYTIVRLTNKELWYTFENGGDKHELHLTKQ